MLNKVNDFINDYEFRLTLYKDKVHIINYIDILSLHSNEVIVRCSNSLIIIKGSNLVLNKLFDKEVLILGIINNIGVSYE